MASSSTQSDPFPWLVGDSEMTRRVRELDWSSTLLGPVESWPAALRTTFTTSLDCAFPIIMLWGPDFVFLYNEEYRPSLGAKHPAALGQAGAVVWAEIWDVIGPMLAGVLERAETTRSRDQCLFIERHGYSEETYWSFSYSPVFGDDGKVDGIYCPVIETTQKVIAERRLRTLRDLAAQCKGSESEAATYASAIRVLQANGHDVPFALIYRIEQESVAVLEAATGIEAGSMAAPKVIALHDGDDDPWSLAQVMCSGKAALLTDLATRFDTLPTGPWQVAAHSAQVLPLLLPGQENPHAILVMAVNPMRALDADYRTFFELVATQIASGIADTRALEEERRRTRALAEIDRAKTAFFSNVSHEFRTPLTLILGPLDDEIAAATDAAQRERLLVLRRNAQRLQKLVNSLLDFSRIEAGRIQASYEPVDLAEFTAELASVFRSAIETVGMRLIVDCAPLAEPVYVDRDMYEKIVLNLISNAFKFTLEGEIEVCLREVGNAIELCVRDTGCGIAQSQLPHVFERFHRVEGVPARTQEGTGIGLALVQELARLHGGTVAVQSVEGHGSTFTITFPKGHKHLPAERIVAARAAAPAATVDGYFVDEASRWLPQAPPSLPAISAGARARIVLADDNADMRDYVSRLLGSRYDVETVANGRAALAAIRRQRADLVLSDVMMPELDGFGLLRALRDDEQTRNIPLILLSARAGEEARVEGMQAGADDYLVKPFSARELLAHVEAHIEMARQRHRHEAQTSADLQAMTLLYDVGNRIARAGDDMQRCLDEIVDAAIALTGADKGSIQLIDSHSGRQGVGAQRGFQESFLTYFRTAPDYTSACELALQSRQRVVVEDVTQSPLFASQPWLPMLLDAGVRAVHSTPLISSAGTVLGTIATHFARPHRPCERELRLVDLLARQAADFLELRQSEWSVRESEARYRTLFDSIDEGYCIVRVLFDAAGKPCDYVFEEVNQSFERHTGIRNAAGRTMLDIEPTHERHWFEIYGRIAVSGEPERFVNQAAALQRWYDVYAFRIGEPRERRVAILFQDITERKRMEDALRASEKRLRTIIEQLPAGVGVFDKTGNWMLSNSEMQRYLPRGIPSTQPDQLPRWQAWDRQGNPIAPDNWPGKRALRGEEVVPGMEMLYTDSDDARSWMRVSSAPLRDDAGDIIGACSVMQDITQQKNAEQALREADRRKDEFLATLAHELRNPLAPIRNGLHVLRRTGDHGGATERVHEMLESQINHLVRLVDDLLEVSRITGGKIELRKERVDLATVLGHALEISAPLIESARHVLTVERCADVLTVDADPVRLAQVIANLLNNAAKYTDDGGDIRLATYREGGDAVISVRDNGVGIPRGMLSKVFDLFTQVEGNHLRAQGGLGIGLTLVRSLVEMHGGSVDVRSDGVYKGSEFLVRLPIVAKQLPPGHEHPPEPAVCTTPHRILIVDDNRDAGDTLGMILKLQGAETLVVRDGPSALAALGTLRPDIVMLDIGLPGMDGYEVARRARQLPEGRNATLIAVTGWGQEDDRRRSTEAGIDHHLVKPVDIRALEQLLSGLSTKNVVDQPNQKSEGVI